MAERSKAAVLKTVEGATLREFESHSLRQLATKLGDCNEITFGQKS